jgi:hypothetical protein
MGNGEWRAKSEIAVRSSIKSRVDFGGLKDDSLCYGGSFSIDESTVLKTSPR